MAQFKMPSKVTGEASEFGPDGLPAAARPKATRGRYYLPKPDNGKRAGWTRVSNLIKLFDDTALLHAWEMRHVIRGLSMDANLVEAAVGLDVRRDKDALNGIARDAKNTSDAYAMSAEGTALHKSTEIADFAGGDLSGVPEHHRARVQLYLDTLKAKNLAVVPGMIERAVVSEKYQVAGTFDRIYEMADGTYVLGDLKTGDSLDFAMPGISAQMDCYEDGINNHGIWDGVKYDRTIRVRSDFALVVHLPSTRDECQVYVVKLDAGRFLNSVNKAVQDARRVRAKDVSEVFDPRTVRPLPTEDVEADLIEKLNAAHTRAELIQIARQANALGQWSERLANVARNLAAERVA